MKTIADEVSELKHKTLNISVSHEACLEKEEFNTFINGDRIHLTKPKEQAMQILLQSNSLDVREYVSNVLDLKQNG